MTKPITERTILAEMIQIYRDNPCLWDPDNKHYTNRLFRERAIKLMVDKYKLLDENACLKTVKRKMEFMRAVYRRELTKVLEANEAGEEYEPRLWYYEHMSFLSSVLHFPKLKNPYIGTTPKDIAHVNVNQTQSDDEPETKRIKKSQSSEDAEDNDDEEVEEIEAEDETEIVNEVEISSPQDRKYVTGSATKAPIVFGRALGLQLMELQPIQRYIAEKLISDVIYYGRMEKLNLDTSININQEWP